MAVTNRIRESPLLSRRMPPPNLEALEEVASRKDVLDAVKALRDDVKGLMEKQIKSLHGDMEGDVSSRLDNLERTVKGFFHKEIEKEVKSFGSGMASGMRGDLESKIKVLGDSLDLMSQEVKSLRNDLEEKEKELQESQEKNLILLKELIASTPKVNVTLPEMAPNVNVSLPEMKPSINLPEMSPVVNVPEQKTIFQVPEAKAPDIVVNVPKQETPVVNIQQPQPRKLVKSIIYDQYNRPAQITEESEGGL